VGQEQARIPLCHHPSSAELDPGRRSRCQAARLFYPLPAPAQRALPAGPRLPHPVPPLAGRILPRCAPAVPGRVRLRLPPQGRPPLGQARPAPAPQPLPGRRRCLLRPPRWRAALHDRLDRPGRRPAVAALLRRALWGADATLRQRPAVRGAQRWRSGAQPPGSETAGARHGRAWALLPKVRPWQAAVARTHGGHASAAVRRNSTATRTAGCPTCWCPHHGRVTAVEGPPQNPGRSAFCDQGKPQR
jgi:hypothetical protein